MKPRGRGVFDRPDNPAYRQAANSVRMNTIIAINLEDEPGGIFNRIVNKWLTKKNHLLILNG